MASPLPPPLGPGVHLQLFFPSQRGTKYQAGRFCIVRQPLVSFLSDASPPDSVLVAAWSRRAAPEERKEDGGKAVRPVSLRAAARLKRSAGCLLPSTCLALKASYFFYPSSFISALIFTLFSPSPRFGFSFGCSASQ